MSLVRKAFKRLHYPVDVFARRAHWSVAYSLSLRKLEEMMAVRSVSVDHSTLHRWGIRMVPLLNKVFVVIIGVPADAGEWTKRIST